MSDDVVIDEEFLRNIEEQGVKLVEEIRSMIGDRPSDSVVYAMQILLRSFLLYLASSDDENQRKYGRGLAANLAMCFTNTANGLCCAGMCSSYERCFEHSSHSKPRRSPVVDEHNVRYT